MTIRSHLLPCASLVVSLCAASSVRAQEDAPLLFLIETADAVAASVTAGPQHVGDTVFIVLTRSVEPETALVEGHLVSHGRLDAGARFWTELALPERIPDASPFLLAVVMDEHAELTASPPMALPNPEDDQTSGYAGATPAVPCLFPPPPFCGAGQLPDLFVRGITLVTVNTSAACTGQPRPWVGCGDGILPGQRSFQLRATIQNNGSCAVPCKTPLSIKWGKGPAPNAIVYEFFNQTVPISDLLPGGIVTISRPYYMGPCDVVNPSYNTQWFGAIVDPLNTIAESNESNNTGTPVSACNFD